MEAADSCAISMTGEGRAGWTFPLVGGEGEEKEAAPSVVTIDFLNKQVSLSSFPNLDSGRPPTVSSRPGET